jgi:hypothetical protein
VKKICSEILFFISIGHGGLQSPQKISAKNLSAEKVSPSPTSTLYYVKKAVVWIKRNFKKGNEFEQPSVCLAYRPLVPRGDNHQGANFPDC